jgi:hypothetical protein
MAKGHTQREGIDYEETFSQVVRFASIRLILGFLATVLHLDLEIFQMDVKTTFLKGKLDKIYMDHFLILSLYVDDILLAENDMKMIVLYFEMDMGEANYVLGVKILRD